VRFFVFVAASTVHAIGHATLALVASGLVLGLVRAWGNQLGSSPADTVGAAAPYAGKALSLSAIGLAAVVVKGAAGVYATYAQRRVAAEVGNDLRLRLLDSLLAVHRLRQPRQGDHAVVRAPAEGPEPAAPGPTAAALAALTDRVREVETGLQFGLLGGMRAVAQLVPLAVVLFVLSQRLAVVGVMLLLAFGVVLGRVRAGFRAASRRIADESERLLEAADESVRHADLWVTFGAESKARANVQRLGDALGRGAAALDARASLLGATNEVLAAGLLVGMLGAARAGWLGAVEGEGALLAFAVAFFMAYRPLRDLAEARLAWARACEAYDAVQRRLAPIELQEGAHSSARARKVESQGVSGWRLADLELRGVRLARGSSASLSLQIEPGAVVAVCGATGVGKTTLLRTLLGLERPLAGEVLFDGAPLADAAGPANRPFAWVPQDAPLLADTLAANVALGGHAPHTDAAVREVLRGLGAERLLSSLGAEERLGGGGRPVSGGERQWIALARAVATAQPVLLLDEPTSGLDADSQRRVLEAIARLRGRRTVIIVTHRPEPLAIADAVVRLGPGEDLEQAA
jgi:ABC-type multidrug transport system fused ATPase/permease subunit